MKKIQKIVGLVLIIILVLQNIMGVLAEESIVDLTKVSKEECLDILLNNGLIIPESYNEYDDVAGFVKKIVDSVYDNPTTVNWFSFAPAQDFALHIREVVINYAELDVANSTVTYASSLMYSYALSNWNSSFSYYNCYAYAIDVLTEGRISPGYAIGLEISAENLQTMSILRLASLVTYDLQELGYSEITYGVTLPEYQSGYVVIAVRKNTNDFHFMYMYSPSVWRHKPGTSAILQFRYSSLTAAPWTNEGLYSDGYQSYNTTYDSDIIYIKYKL